MNRTHEPRYYIVRVEIRDAGTFGESHVLIQGTSRDEAISKARAKVRNKTSRRRIVKVISAKKEAHS